MSPFYKKVYSVYANLWEVTTEEMEIEAMEVALEIEAMEVALEIEAMEVALEIEAMEVALEILEVVLKEEMQMQIQAL